MVAAQTPSEPVTVVMVTASAFDQLALRDLFSHDLRFKLLGIAATPAEIETAIAPDVVLFEAAAGGPALLQAARAIFRQAPALS